MLICIFVGWVWGFENYKKALTNGGTLKNEALVKGLFFVTKFIAPVLVLLVLLNGLKIISQFPGPQSAPSRTAYTIPLSPFNTPFRRWCRKGAGQRKRLHLSYRYNVRHLTMILYEGPA